ncbi:MAG: hypothetical protein V4657_09065, partial [Pseudomonadota bacterium]
SLQRSGQGREGRGDDMRAEARHTAYLSPTDNWTGANIEQSDRAHYRRVQEASDKLRRAVVRYQQRNSTFTIEVG